MSMPFIHVETSKKFLLHQISKSYHHMYLKITPISPKSKDKKIIIYKKSMKCKIRINGNWKYVNEKA